MDDTPITEMTNSELAFLLREGGHPVDASWEALARLLEADAKNHDFIANRESKWRNALAAVVLAWEYYRVSQPPEIYPREPTDATDATDASWRVVTAIMKASELLKEGEKHFTEPYPES